MNQNSYAGREYLQHLNRKHLSVDVITIGNYPEIDILEEARCGSLWKPPTEQEVMKDLQHKHFKSLKSKELIEYLTLSKYDIGIQGGTGIIRNNIIECFKYGILNFHPGDLPEYRGCSAPEYQIVDGKPIVTTCHYVVKSIDAGPILAKKVLNVKMDSYESFRASIYPEIGLFLAETISKIETSVGFFNKAQVQDESKSKYRKYIGDENIELLKQKFIKGQFSGSNN